MKKILTLAMALSIMISASAFAAGGNRIPQGNEKQRIEQNEKGNKSENLNQRKGDKGSKGNKSNKQKHNGRRGEHRQAPQQRK